LVDCTGCAVDWMTTVGVEDLFDVDAGVGASDWSGWDLMIVVDVILEGELFELKRRFGFRHVKPTVVVIPYSLLAPSVCICDFLRSAITEFLRTSKARIVSARIVIRRVKIGVPALFSSFCAVSLRKRFLKATSSVPI
jgi:hypothetical protein